MKKTFFILILSLSIFSCTKNDDATPQTQDVKTLATQGVWKISSFIDNKKRDRTDKYAAYSFEFSTNGSLKINFSGSSITGTWTTQKEGVKDRLVLTFATAVPEEILDLNDDWYVMQKTDTSMFLQKINGYWEVGAVQKEMMFKKS